MAEAKVGARARKGVKETMEGATTVGRWGTWRVNALIVSAGTAMDSVTVPRIVRIPEREAREAVVEVAETETTIGTTEEVGRTPIEQEATTAGTEAEEIGVTKEGAGATMIETGATTTATEEAGATTTAGVTTTETEEAGATTTETQSTETATESVSIGTANTMGAGTEMMTTGTAGIAPIDVLEKIDMAAAKDIDRTSRTPFSLVFSTLCNCEFCSTSEL